MDFEKLRNLKLGQKLRINNLVLTIIEISHDINIIEYYLRDTETNLEFMLRVPEDEHLENFQFFKVYLHGTEKTTGVPNGFKNTVELI